MREEERGMREEGGQNVFRPERAIKAHLQGNPDKDLSGS